MKIRSFFFMLILTVVFSCQDNKTAIENFNAGLEYYKAENYSSALNEFTKSVSKKSLFNITFSLSITKIF